MLKSDTQKSDTIRSALLNLLSRRDYSKRELLLKIKAKGLSISIAEEVINTLAESGLQSDSRFAECYVRYRSSKGYGPYRIFSELVQKGIEKEVITDVLQKHKESFNESKECLIQKLSHLDKPMLKLKLYQRGYEINSEGYE